MLRCNLAILLAERNIKITKVSKDTGISRTTLTSLSSNASQGIQFETLNTLCQYLNIQPSALLNYVPYDLEVSKAYRDDDMQVIVEFNYKKNNKEFFLITICEYNYFDLSDNVLNIKLGLRNEAETDDYCIDTAISESTVCKAIKLLPNVFTLDIERAILDKLSELLEFSVDNLKYLIDWSDILNEPYL